MFNKNISEQRLAWFMKSGFRQCKLHLITIKPSSLEMLSDNAFMEDYFS